MRAALALARRGLGAVWPNPAVGCVLCARPLGGRPRLDPAGRPPPRRGGGAGPRRRRRLRGDRVRDAGAVRSPRPGAAVRAGARPGGSVAGGHRLPRPRPSRRGEGDGGVAGSGRRCRRGRRRVGGAGAQRRVLLARPARAPARHAQGRVLAGWTHRHAHGREPLDHRRRGTRDGPRPARAARRRGSGFRHRAGRRSAADLPSARARGPRAGARGFRPPPADAADPRPGCRCPRRSHVDRRRGGSRSGPRGRLPRARGGGGSARRGDGGARGRRGACRTGYEGDHPPAGGRRARTGDGPVARGARGPSGLVPRTVVDRRRRRARGGARSASPRCPRRRASGGARRPTSAATLSRRTESE